MLEKINAFLWGVPVLGLILGTGVWLAIRTGAVQVRLFPAAWKSFLHRLRDRDTGFRALCTALAATVGTGNIAGVAGAIAIGGPGAVLWMWVSAFLGMGVKYAEAALAVRYREQDGRAGTMYIIRNGLGQRWRWMAGVYALFGLAAAFGVGNATQVNAVMTALESAGVGSEFAAWFGLGMAVLVAVMVAGGARRLTEAAEALVPVVSGAYILLCLAALWLRRGAVIGALADIFRGAFDPAAVTGGAVGSAASALRIGVSRGTFTNEAGMGTAAIAHGSAEGVQPAQQGMLGIMEVFLDTMVICTMTALVILTGGMAIPYGGHAGAELTASALSGSLGDWVRAALCGCLTLFGMATILGWGFYSGRCAEFLFGGINWRVFGMVQGCAVVLGVFLKTGTVWILAEIVNGLMAMPNLAAILMLTPEVARLTGEYRMCYNLSHRHNKRGKTHERERNRRDPAAHPAGSQQYDGHLRLLRQRGQGGHQQIPAQHRHDARK